MKTSCFSISTNGSNNQGLKKMNPVTVRICDINQHKVVTKLLDMYKSKESMQRPFPELLMSLMPLCQNIVFCGISVSC